ncbi:hypothetical protein [Methanobrevibacter sp.]|uniref:hypothetical protein n=1 Tax=Methanobrevibacter sp. TaxID=66852 RepID=UPI00388FA466
MEITEENIRKIHEKLNEVSPVDYDCGKLCGEICCVYDSEEFPNDDLIIYLLPGEETLYENSKSFELKHFKISEIKYPHSWKDGVYTVKCTNPPNCEREIRPIQCRTFPLIPHITKDRRFHLIFDDSQYPYRCPLIKDNIKLNDDFVKETYKTWRFLLKNRLVYDLVDMDSRKRENRKIKYKKII